MSRVLYLAPRLPFPLTDGGSAAIAGTVRELVRHGIEVHYAAPRGLAGTADGFPPGVRVLQLDATVSKHPVRVVANLSHRLPYYVEKFFSERAVEQLHLLAATEDFDLVHVETLFVVPYAWALRERWKIPIVLRTQNVEAEIVRLFRERARNPLIRAYAGWEHRRLVAFEREALSNADLVLAITSEDEAVMHRLAPSVRSTVIPAGVDTDALRPADAWIPNTVMMFTHALWPPNKDSAEYFFRSIVPLLQRNRPGIRILLAGKGTEILSDVARGQGVECLGFVPDLNALPRLAQVSVVPLRIGSGIRVKILEQMALGMTIVSTSLGVAGIKAVPGRHLEVADDPEGFVQRIAALLDDPARTMRMGREARSLMEAEYSLRRIGDEFLRVYREVTGKEIGRDTGGA
jgi:glycosyltransferase involved in cell wall biosynthesis